MADFLLDSDVVIWHLRGHALSKAIPPYPPRLRLIRGETAYPGRDRLIDRGKTVSAAKRSHPRRKTLVLPWIRLF
ncbi:MAG: hypothetical protein ABUT39_17870 [Acidobacteriota bacterium]